jgi:hypothetical protein
MTTQRILLGGFPLSLLTCALVACAADPNKQANDAHAADLKSERNQQEDRAENRSDQRVAAAEVLREKTEANATGTEARQESVEADAKLTEARTSYRAKATERLEKADAKTSELKQLIDRAGAKATTSSRDRLHTVETQRSMVTKELDQLPRIANDNFQQAKTSLDTQLDILEGLVKKAADEVGKFKR